jgi:D-amino peptidase
VVKLYISADLEGVWGVNTPDQVDSVNQPPGYTQAVAQLAKEITTVANALKSCCDLHRLTLEIVVNDAHFTMANLSVEGLPDWVQLISGKPKPCAMLTGLDPSFDGVILLGYHARAGSRNGVLCHSFHSKIWDLQINNISLGEGGLNALHAWLTYQVPVILASGDDILEQELQALFPELTYVQTKKGLGFAVAHHLLWPAVEATYQLAAKKLIEPRVLRKAFYPLRFSSKLEACMSAPYLLKVTFLNTVQADTACLLPTITRLDGRTITASFPDLESLYLTLQSLYSIQESTDYLN